MQIYVYIYFISIHLFFLFFKLVNHKQIVDVPITFLLTVEFFYTANLYGNNPNVYLV